MDGAADSRLEWSDGVAHHARTVVVPLANPDTATDLLRIARGLLTDEGGRLLATVIVLDEADAEQSRDLSDGMQELVEVMADRLPGATVTFRTRTATSVARGILDAIRDSGADAVVLGLQSADEEDEDDDGSRPGPIVESVIEAATCDVAVYRPAVDRTLEHVERLVVAVDGDLPSRNAVRTSSLLRRGLQVPLDVLHVRGPDVPESRARAVVARSMDGLVDDREATVRLEVDDRVVDGLAGAVAPSDLVVLGLGHDDRVASLAEGSVARGLLDDADVAVLAVVRARPTRSGLQHRLRRAASWLHPRLTDVEQESIRSYGEGAAAPTLDYLAMTALSGLIASFGLLLDSAAVIIGAMLIAPLMQPLQAFGIGVVAGRSQVALRALGTVLLGSALVLGVAALTGLAVGVATPTLEMTSRGSPSLLDAGVALAAGIAGAYATARKDIPAALAGVAIAAALVPPIGAAGLGLAAGRLGLAGGATLLFTVNIACIAVVSAVVFQWLALRPRDRTRTERGQVALAAASVGALVVLLVALVVVDARRVRVDERPLEARLVEQGIDADLVEVTVVTDAAPTTVRVVVDLLEPDATSRERLADIVTTGIRDQVGDRARTRLVVREVVASG